LRHKILYTLIKDLNLEIEPFSDPEENNLKKLIGFYKNTPIHCEDDYKKLFSLNQSDLPYLNPEDYDFQVKPPRNGNLFAGTVGETGQKAKDMSLRQYYSRASNSEILARGFMLHSMDFSVADTVTFAKQYKVTDKSDVLGQTHCIKGGMVKLIRKLVSMLEKLENISLVRKAMVMEVSESRSKFKVVTASTESFTGKKLILACNKEGIEWIAWSHPVKRNAELKKLLVKTKALKATKVFLTYSDAWWEKLGLGSGTFGTDLPISCVTARGSHGKKGGYATLMAAYTYMCSDVFEGLNQSTYARFQPSSGNVPCEYLPSQKLVDFVQDQLCTVFGESKLIG